MSVAPIVTAQELRNMSPDGVRAEAKRMWAEAILEIMHTKVLLAAREGKTSYTATITHTREPADEEMVEMLLGITRNTFPGARVIYSDAIGLTIDWAQY
jgi:hypothetical protein